MNLSLENLGKQIYADAYWKSTENGTITGSIDVDELVADYQADIEICETKGYVRQNFGMGTETFEVSGDIEIINIDVSEVTVFDNENDEMRKFTDEELDKLNTYLNE